MYVTGDEIVRVARTLDAPPWAFTIAVPTTEAAEDAFALDRSTLRYRAALTKLPYGERERCIFLLRLAEGTARCGLGESRPAPCRSFPAELHQGALRVSAAGCTCHDWSLDDIDLENDRELLLAESAARAEYARLVGNWNAHVAAAAGTEPFAYADFCRFLLDQYAGAR